MSVADANQDFMEDYEILTNLSLDSSVLLIRNKTSGELLVCKMKKNYNLKIMECLKDVCIPGIPRIYDFKEEDNMLLSVEEFFHGKTLEQVRNEKGTLSEIDSLAYMIQLCDILQRLHNLQPPIIHRDIKPENIILTNEGFIKLIDFNGCKEENVSSKQDTVMFGTHQYAAPEQYGFGHSDRRTDIYQVGVTLNVLLTGKYPIEETYKGRLGRVISKCTAYNQNERYQSVEQLSRVLKTLHRNLMEPEKESMQKTKESSKWHKKVADSYAPPGFRSQNFLIKFLAAGLYIAFFWLFATMQIEDSMNPGQYLTGWKLFLERAVYIIIVLFAVLLLGNYRGLFDKLPGNSFFTRLISSVIAIVIFTFIIIIIMMKIEGVL
ncbi:MAG: serine/threonine protein kinase [Eubacterium sp.]|nr:serine/threonine protein kinase [Eubacterium sp.]